MIITDDHITQLSATTPERRIALMLFWLFESDIIDDDAYAQAVALALDPTDDVAVDIVNNGGRGW